MTGSFCAMRGCGIIGCERNLALLLFSFRSVLVSPVKDDLRHWERHKLHADGGLNEIFPLATDARLIAYNTRRCRPPVTKGWLKGLSVGGCAFILLSYSADPAAAIFARIILNAPS